MKNIKLSFLLFAFAVSFQLVAQQGVELKNIKEVNGKELDFSPVPYRNGIIFTTSKSNRFLKCPSQNAGDYTDVKYSEKKADGTFSKPVPLAGNVNGKYNDGCAAFNQAGDKMIFSRNNMSGKNDSNIIDLKLYSADLVGDKWTNVTELPFNSDDWSTCHPALSKDGSLLVFASNRPGSTENSMDLWSSKLENGVWSVPANLGAAVNTGSNELFPYLDENNNLFFSSNRPGGAGGLDIWAAAMNANGDWELIGNLGAPFNQGGDDVNFVSLNGGTEGYFASNRTNNDAQGMDDIYHWTYSPPIVPATIVVVDKETQERLTNSSVELTPVEFGIMLDRIYGGGPIAAKANTMMTDRNGAVTLQVRKGSKYAIVTSKENYKTDKREVAATEITAKPEYIIPLEKSVCYVKLIVEVVEDPSGKPIALADIKIVDRTTGKTINLTSDASGLAYLAQIDCDHEYEITGNKDNYSPNTIPLKEIKSKMLNGEVRVKVPLKAPVMLEPIFFDFDEYYIREKDAVPTMDNLVSILNRYPSLEIRLSGNTDSRGTNKYNDKLGRNRANSAKNYLIKKGIKAERLYTEDFGETKPINNCTDDVVCPETDHQLNRRVDVTAERHSEPGVTFRTRPVSEMNVESDRKDKKK